MLYYDVHLINKFYASHFDNFFRMICSFVVFTEVHRILEAIPILDKLKLSLFLLVWSEWTLLCTIIMKNVRICFPVLFLVTGLLKHRTVSTSHWNNAQSQLSDTRSFVFDGNRLINWLKENCKSDHYTSSWC